MSNTAALALVIASFFVGGLAYFYWWKWAHELACEIIGPGAAGNAALPLPSRWRWHLLHTRYVYIVISITGSSAVVAAVSVEIAKLASDPGAKTVAYAVATLSALVAGGSFLHGALEFLLLRRLLRQAAAD